MGAGAQKYLAERDEEVLRKMIERMTPPVIEEDLTELFTRGTSLRVFRFSGTDTFTCIGTSGDLARTTIRAADEPMPDADTTPPLIPGGWFNYIPAKPAKHNKCDGPCCNPVKQDTEPFHNPFREFFGDDKRIGAAQWVRD